MPVVLPTLCRGGDETEPRSAGGHRTCPPRGAASPAQQWPRVRPPLAGPPGSGLAVPRGAAGAGRHGALLPPLHPFDVRAAQVPSAPKSRHRLRRRNRPATAVLRPGLTPYPCPRPARGEGTLLPTPPRLLAISLCSRGHHAGLVHGDAARGAPRAPRPSQGAAAPHLHAGLPAGLHFRRARPQQDQGTSSPEDGG